MDGPLLIDRLALDPDAERRDVMARLLREPASISPKYFYDEVGCALYGAICRLPEYYPTRTEGALMRRYGREMAEALGSNALLIEYGSGSSLKTRILLDHLHEPAAYVPVDISREHLLASAASIAAAYPGLEVRPVCADFTQPFAVPTPRRAPWQRVVYFPGSTIGNFPKEEAGAFLKEMARVAGPGGGLLIGVDLKKDRQVLHAAYNDAAGVTADFNLNLLTRINRELGADFNTDAFAHDARWSEAEGRIEMHLVSRRPQTVQVVGERFDFARGESLLTEYSCKYALDEFLALAAPAGFALRRTWVDGRGWFGVLYLVAR